MIKKFVPIFLTLSCVMPLNTMSPENMSFEKRKGLLAFVREGLRQKKQNIDYTIATNDDELSAITCLVPTQQTSQKSDIIIVKEDDSKKSGSYFSLPTLGVPQVVKNVGSYFYSLIRSYKDWENPFFIPSAGDTWSMEMTTSHNGKNYLCLFGNTEAAVYNIDAQKLLFKHKQRDNERMWLPFISVDGTCYRLMTLTDNEDDKIYLYNVDKGEKPVLEMSCKRGASLRTKDGGLDFINILESKLEVFNAKTRNRQEVPFNDAIKDFSTLSPYRGNNRDSGYVLITTKSGKVFVADIENNYATTEITYQKSFKLVSTRTKTNYFTALVDGNFCIYYAPQGNDPIFKQPYDGAEITGDCIWNRGDTAKACIFRDDNACYLCNIEEKKIIPIKGGGNRIGSFNMEGDCFYLCEKDNEDRTKASVFYNTKDGKCIHHAEIPGGGKWLAESWFIINRTEKLCYLMNPKTREFNIIDHSGECAWNGNNDRFACWRSVDKKSALFYWINGKELKSTTIKSPDEREFNSYGSVDFMLSKFCISTDKNSYIFNPLNGEIRKQLSNDPEDPVQKWGMDLLPSYYAIVGKKTIRILNHKLDLLTILKFDVDDEVVDGWFDRHDKLFKVQTKKGLVYYVINKDTVSKITENKEVVEKKI